jgi:hypothetical protein
MRYAARMLGLAPALLLVLASPGPAGAASPVPFTGSFTYTHPMPTPVPGATLLPIPGTLLLLVQGTFEGDSDLGPFVGEGTFLFDLSSYSYTGDFRWDFSGGTLKGTAYGQDYPAQTPQGYLTTMTLKVTGGTGCFRGATGIEVGGGTDNFDPMGTSEVEIRFIGTLLSP